MRGRRMPSCASIQGARQGSATTCPVAMAASAKTIVVPATAFDACTAVIAAVGLSSIRAGKAAFTEPRGRQVVAPVADAGMRQFVRGLKLGGLVNVVFAEAIGVRAEPANK